ncbi:methylated-DNA--[protein]-cysteine S-methyltransferase [Marinicella litoralis]|uniref:Methylated-DNA--protein-cysteine methyltransferase n=1 Tax=Marinicella litoralis TaxID=644220 RepID=A0A4R6XMV7_9GAMM|nr:methylated-DNA--[protein]-cysteine S-methyltransferase [Marinicella litoralis]TDR17438.1 methylated-DNA-[protein]-cysteine S-methyltransferase [Marinicella litoralis]
MYIEYMDTPIGQIEITASDVGVCSVHFMRENKVKTEPNLQTNQWTRDCKNQLNEYFTGDRKEFDLMFDQQGTEFQKQVWQALLTIPFGQLASYRDMAEQIDNPKAVRAVGAANGRNPISIIIPCHRVIGSNGTLTGYAGGLARKQWLLQHEGKRLFDV